jgi:hypothetical protein
MPVTELIVDLLLAAVCIAVPTGIVGIAAILGTRSKLRYADRLRAAQARGAFADMNEPQNKSRFRRLAILALSGILGMILSLAILVLQLRRPIADYYGITLAVAILFVTIGFIAGLLMQREFDRRL